MIPPLIKEAIDKHVREGKPCGHFVTAVLENNLVEAIVHADETNLDNIYDIVRYCYNHIPSPCWGSVEKVQAWREKGGDPNAYIEE
jgi:hypothetical protein